MISWAFTILGLTLLVTGVTMNCILKVHFKKYYSEFKCLLWVAAIGLAVPLFLRAIIDNVRGKSIKFTNWTYSHNTGFDCIFTVFSTWIPIIMQMSSLVFGITRHSRDKKINDAFDNRSTSVMKSKTSLLDDFVQDGDDD